MFQVVGRVSKAGALTNKDGVVVTNKKSGEDVIVVVIGGRSGITLWPDKELYQLPPLGERVVAHCMKQSWKNDKGVYADSLTITDWELIQ